MNWTLFLVKKYLSLNSKKGMRFIVRLTVFGVMLGVATLTLTQAVLSGFQKEFRKSILGFNAHLVVLKQGEMDHPQQEADKIRNILKDKEVASTPFLYRETLLIHQGKVKGGVLKGIDPLTFHQVYGVGVRSLQTGQQVGNVEELFRVSTKYPRIILGENLAGELGVSATNPLVKVYIATHDAKSFQWFEVVGLFSSGLYEFDRNFAFAELSALQEIFLASGKVSGIEMTLRHPEEADELASLVQRKLGIPYEVVSWQKLNAPLFQALEIERGMFFIIMTMVVGVASFNVVGIILLMVFEKSREISILRALGASYRSIKRWFALQGFVLGGIGVLGGLVLGWLIAELLKYFPIFKLEKEIYLVDKLPVQFSLGLALSIVGAALLIIYLSTRIAVSRIEKSPLDL